MAKVITMFGPSPCPSQTTISGPSAIFGTMLSVTNNAKQVKRQDVSGHRQPG